MDKVHCADCLFEYGAPGWMDALISDDTWGQITPDGAQILCIACINRRCAEHGLSDVPVVITSGALVHGKIMGHLPLRIISL